MHPMNNIALKAARKAGEVVLQSMERLDATHITDKNRHDFVTDINKRAEREISAILKKAYPRHVIIAEESVKHRSEEDSVWVIDPLNGTHNYLRGFPHFSISIAFRHKGKTEHGLVFDPIRQEIFSATRGEGARLNGRRMRVGEATRLENALIGTGFPVHRSHQLPGYLSAFNSLLARIANVRCSGSAALDLCYVAANRLDAFLETSLNIWDMAAGALIAKEAGSLVSDWQGLEKYLDNGAILATAPKLVSELLDIINPKS